VHFFSNIPSGLKSAYDSGFLKILFCNAKAENEEKRIQYFQQRFPPPLPKCIVDTAK
jgi:hypothetical protein